MTSINHTNQNEVWKKEKDGLEILKEMDALAETPFEQIDKSDIERLKWAGIYCQRPKNGRFLIRVKLSSGKLTADQAGVIAGISHDYGADSIQITIRQCIQVHNLQLSDMPDIFARLKKAGLTTVEGCGDVPRNILGNPLMGVDPEELFDTTPVVEEAARRVVGNPLYSNLPRKFKLSFSANPHDPGYAGINDLAFVPAVSEEGETGFHAWIGGGLSAEPMLAKKLSFFIPAERAVDVAEAAAAVFRDHGFREARNHCRLKYLVEKIGTARTEEMLEAITGPLPRGGRAVMKSWNRGNFYGIHRQKQDGLCYAGLAVPGGTMTAPELMELAELARQYGDGEMRTTNTHQILILNIPEEKTAAFRKEPVLKKFKLSPGAFSGYAASCTGNQYCNFAGAETKQRLKLLTEELDRRFPHLRMPVRVNMTGCPHSCAHPQIADIGLTCAKIRTEAGVKDGFSVCVGGHLGKDPRFGFRLEGRILSEKTADFITDAVRYYLDNRKKGERFYSFAERAGAEPFQKLLNIYTQESYSVGVSEMSIH